MSLNQGVTLEVKGETIGEGKMSSVTVHLILLSERESLLCKRELCNNLKIKE